MFQKEGDEMDYQERFNYLLERNIILNAIQQGQMSVDSLPEGHSVRDELEERQRLGFGIERHRSDDEMDRMSEDERDFDGDEIEQETRQVRRRLVKKKLPSPVVLAYY